MLGRSCLILGAGGFLGSALSSALHVEGASVHGFGRTSHHESADRRTSWTVGALSDRDALRYALDGKDTVFHFISSYVPSTSNRDPAEALLQDVYHSIRLLDLCREAGVKRFIFASSGGTVYGAPANVPTPEDAPTNPISAYGINKLAFEKFLLLYRHLHGMQSISLRIANPYGPGQSPKRGQGVVAAIVHSALSSQPFEIWGDGEIVRDFIHVSDVVTALVASANYEGDASVVNVGSGVGISINDMIARVESVLGLSAINVIRTPSRAADVPVSVLDISRAITEFGWKPVVTLERGILDTAAWMRNTPG